MKYFFPKREEKFCISKRPCNVLFIIIINTNEIPNHFSKIVFWSEGVVYYEATAMVIFSHVKISSFRMKAHLVFHWCLYDKQVSYNIM